MIVLLPMLMAYSLIGEAAHEWLGLTMTACFIVHQVLNLKWYCSLTRSHYTLARTAGTVLNFLLLFILLAQGISGILMSRYAIPISGSGGMSTVRTLHLLGSQWGFVLLSVHLGFHWNVVTGAIRRKWNAHHVALTWLMRILALAVAVWGIYVFLSRQMVEYLFLRSQFVFFDFSTSRAVYVAETCAVMGLFCCSGYYLQKALHTMPMRLKRSNKQ